MTSPNSKTDSAKPKKDQIKAENPASLPPVKPTLPQRPPQQIMRPQRIGGARPMMPQKAGRKR